MGAVVVLDQAGALGPDDLPESVVEGLLGQARVQARQCLLQPPRQDHLAIAPPLGARLTRCDARATGDGVANLLQPFESGFLDVRFGKAVATHDAPSEQGS